MARCIFPATCAVKSVDS